MSNSAPLTAKASAVALRDVRKVHGRGEGAVVALDGVSAALSPGSFTAIMGPSGSGKSTLLNVAAGLDRPTSGSVALGGTALEQLSERRLTILRRERIGFVFQAFNLLPSLTIAQNIALPLRLDGHRPRRSAVRDIAARVGLEKRLRDRPSQLSGGQQQRVAIARALITRPEVVFADEPTGALDTQNGRGVLALLREVVDEDGHTVVMVTHDPVAAAYADRVLLLADGRVAGTLDAPSADDVAKRLAGHLTSPLLNEILVQAGQPASVAAGRLRALAQRYPGLHVSDSASLVTANAASDALDHWFGPFFVAMIFTFTSIAVANTLIMIALRRRRELALLRLTGATTRQVRSMARWEAILIITIGLGTGLAITAIALVPLSHALTGGFRPYAPAGWLAAILGVSALVALVALSVPTRRALRTRPVEAIGIRE